MSTLKQMSDRVIAASDRLWSSDRSEVNALVNRAYFEVVREGRTTLTKATLALVPGEGDYSLSDLPILGIKYIAFTSADGNTRYATPVGFDEIVNWRGLNSAGSSGEFSYSLGGLDFLSIYPNPGATDTAVIYYFHRPDPLGSDSDFPPDHILPQEFHNLIELRALQQSARTIHKGRNQVGAQTSQMYANQYDEGIRKLRSYVNHQLGSRNRSAQIGYPRVPARSNDTYYSPWGRG